MSYLPSNVNNIIVIPYITDYDIMTIIKGINNSSPGWDNIPATLLKQCIPLFITPLTYIINTSIETGVFLDPLKMAKRAIIWFIDKHDLLYTFQFGFSKTIFN